MGTTNILDLNNRLTKVEKGNVAQNSYTSLKNKPKINNITLTGNKSLADIGAAAAADLTALEGDVGDKTQLNTTDKSSTVAAINEVNGKIGDFIDISSNVTVDSHITLINNNLTLQKIGKMVFLNLMFTTTAEIPVYTKIIDNIPYTPIINSQGVQVFKQSSKDAFILTIAKNSGTNTCYIATLDAIPTSTNVRSVLPIAVGN